RRHPDDRALGTFSQVLTSPFAGADHRERALIAASVYYRYSGDEDFPREAQLGALLGPEEIAAARRLGLSLRLAFALSASAPGELQHYGLKVTPSRIILEIPRRRAQIASEPVQKRLAALAGNMGRKWDIVNG
ncbi:MAG TPA: hypothetical protein VGK90_13435, partial [Rhizomicrobium sp.]